MTLQKRLVFEIRFLQEDKMFPTLAGKKRAENKQNSYIKCVFHFSIKYFFLLEEYRSMKRNSFVFPYFAPCMNEYATVPQKDETKENTKSTHKKS